MKVLFENWRKFLKEQEEEPTTKPKAIFMAGGPGSGKSTVLKNLGLKEKMPNVIYSFFNDGNLEFSFKTNIIFWLVFLSFFIIPIFIILNSKKYKNKDIRMKFSITMGILIAMLSIPRLVSYDLIICLPVSKLPPGVE